MSSKEADILFRLENLNYQIRNLDAVYDGDERRELITKKIRLLKQLKKVKAH